MRRLCVLTGFVIFSLPYAFDFRMLSARAEGPKRRSAPSVRPRP